MPHRRRQGPDIAEYHVILHSNAFLCAVPHRAEAGAGVGAAFLRREHELADQAILDFQSTGAGDHFGNLRRDDDIDRLAAGFLCIAWLDPDPSNLDLRFFQHADIDAARLPYAPSVFVCWPIASLSLPLPPCPRERRVLVVRYLEFQFLKVFMDLFQRASLLA